MNTNSLAGNSVKESDMQSNEGQLQAKLKDLESKLAKMMNSSQR